MNWVDCLNTFMKVVESKSFAKAAELQDVPPSTITRRINWLEDYLSAKVLTRTTRTLVLTDAGRDLYLYGQKLLGGWDDFRETISHSKSSISGVIRFDTFPRFQGAIGAEVMAEFLASYPDVAIYHREVTEPYNIETDGVDLYLGLSAPPVNDAKLIKKELVKVPRRYLASQLYLDQYGEPKHPSELVRHRCIIYKEASCWEFSGKQYPLKTVVSTNSPRTVVQLLEKGVGIACFPLLAAKENGEKYDFIPILTNWSCPSMSINLYYLKKPYMPKRVRLFIDFIIKKVRERKLEQFRKILSF